MKRAAVAILAALLAVTLATGTADAKRKPKHPRYGPVCEWKDRRHKGCIVVLMPPWAQPDDVVLVTPEPTK